MERGWISGLLQNLIAFWAGVLRLLFEVIPIDRFPVGAGVEAQGMHLAIDLIGPDLRFEKGRSASTCREGHKARYYSSHCSSSHSKGNALRQARLAAAIPAAPPTAAPTPPPT